MRLRVVLAAIGLLSSAASAEVLPVFEVTNPTLTGMPGYVGLVIRLHSDQGNITAFDFGGTDPAKPNEALKGIFTVAGPFGTVGYSTPVPGLSQRWSAADDGLGNVTLIPTPRGSFAPATLSNPGNRDSYFNQSIVETAIVYSAEEDNTLTGHPNSPTNPAPGTSGTFWGLGTSMHYTSGIALAGQASTVDLAYVVLRADNSVFLKIKGEVAAGGTKVPVEFIFPEPASTSLTILSALVLLRRRS
jgi:hypothetical protein